MRGEESDTKYTTRMYTIGVRKATRSEREGEGVK